MKKKVIALIIAAILIAILPIFLLENAKFGGTDDAGSTVVKEVNASYEPWATPLLGRELPGEVETLFFCIQTGIGVGIIAFFMGRLVERKKWMKEEESH